MIFWLLLLSAQMIEGNTEKRSPTDHSSSNRTLRSLSCPPHEYHNNGLCCKNCPAGTHVSSHCTKDHGPGTCSPCTPGMDFTAEPNGMETCLKCHLCRFKDQVSVGECTERSDYQCQCKAKTFCTTNCHLLCNDCTRCPEGQVVKQECSPTSDTVCEDIPSIHPTTIKGPDDAQILNGSSKALAVALPVSLCIAFLVCVSFLLFWRKKQKDKEKEAGSRNENYETSPFEDSPQAVWIIHAMAQPVPRQVNNLQAQRSYTPLGQQDIEEFFPVGRSNQCGVMEPSCQGEVPSDVLNTDPTDNHPTSSEASICACEGVEFNGDRILTDEEWFECYNSLKQNVLPGRWKEMMRHLGLCEVDIESIHLNYKDFGEVSYQMFLLWRNQNGQSASMGKVFHVLDKMNLRGCKENIANGLTLKGIHFT